MKKYSRDLVEKYINGEDIEDYSLDELENDKNFMMLVISQTTDRKMYNYCSESVKSEKCKNMTKTEVGNSILGGLEDYQYVVLHNWRIGYAA